MLTDFNKFERARDLLERYAPEDMDDAMLEAEGLTAEAVDMVNEGLLGDLFGGWFKKMKKGILRKMPGGVLKKVDAIMQQYEKESGELMKKSLKEKEKMFKAEVGAEKDPKDRKRYQQVMSRAEEAIKAIAKASSAKIDRFNEELKQLAKDKSELVSDYINLKIAEVKERVADTELKAIQKFASEAQVERAAKEVDKKRQAREKLQKEIEKAVK